MRWLVNRLHVVRLTRWWTSHSILGLLVQRVGLQLVEPFDWSPGLPAPHPDDSCTAVSIWSGDEGFYTG